MSQRIFIIEDDANILAGLKAKFSLEKFAVETEVGVEEMESILNKIRIFSPNYIILDLILPKIDGFDLLARLKADRQLSAIPVFIFTNLSDADSKSRGENLGGDYYFIKSDFGLDEFVNKVKNIIRNRHQ